MKLKNYLLVGLFSLVLVGCEKNATNEMVPGAPGSETTFPDTIASDTTELDTLSQQVDGNSEAAIRIVLADAQEKLRRSAERGFAWTGTADLLEQATQALEKGELERADELSEMLLRQASALVQQADHNDASWLDAVPK